MAISHSIFDKMIDGKEKNMVAVSPTMEDYGFGQLHVLSTFTSNTYDYRMFVSVEDSKVILHTGFTRKVKTTLVEKAAAKLMELNAKYGFQLGIDVNDGEITYDHTFLLRATPVTHDAFADLFPVYLHNIDACVDILSKEMRDFFPSLLDDDEEPDFHERLRQILAEHRGMELDLEDELDTDLVDIDLDDLEFDFDDARSEESND